MVGKRCSQVSAPSIRPSSQTCEVPSSRIRRMIALATTSRGARSASGCWSAMKRTPLPSSSTAPSPRTASDTSGCCPWASGPSHMTVGWNWTNSRSATSRARAQRERHAVAGGHVRVGRLAEHLAEAAGREDDDRGQGRADAVALARAHDVQGDALRRPRCVAQQVEGEGVLDDLDAGVELHGRHQRPRDLGSGGVAARVRDAIAQVTALAGQRDGAARIDVEVRADLDEVAHGRGPLGDEDPDGLLVAQPDSGDEGVVQVLVRASPRPTRAAAMPPCAHRVEPSLTCALVTSRTVRPMRTRPQRRGEAGDARARRRRRRRAPSTRGRPR